MRLSHVLLMGAVLLDSPVDAATSKTCCGALSRDGALRNKVHLPGTTSFTDSIAAIWSLSARQEPWCIVQPESAQDASKIMKVISRHQCPFSVRSGGHSHYGFSNSVEEGIGIDFGHMQAVKYRKEKGVVEIGAGARSGSVYQSLEPDGVAVVVARNSPVGVAGFITGGGNSYFTNSHGWGGDNVVNFEVVLADGRIVNANKDQNSDLWVALRGSSCNLGLVTRFDMRPIPYADPSNPLIYGGVINYDLSKESDVIATYMNFVDEFSDIDYLSSATIWSQYDCGTDETRLNVRLINVANINNSTAHSGFFDFGGINSSTLRSDSLKNQTTGVAGGDALFNVWFPNSYAHDERIITRAEEMHRQLAKDISEAIPQGDYFFTRAEYQPITSAMINNGLGGGNVMGLERYIKKGPGFLFLIYVGFADAENEEIIKSLARKYLKELDAYATSLGGYWGWKFLPYSNGEQDPISTYGPEAIAKLKKASRKYDPHGVFQKLKSAGFKIPT